MSSSKENRIITYHQIYELFYCQRVLQTQRSPSSIPSFAHNTRGNCLGNEDGTKNGHAYCLKTEKINRTVDKLKAFYPNVLRMPFDNFEALYKWVYEKVMRKIWISVKVLNYDISLKIAANHIDTQRLLPSANVYLHGKPWMAAKALDEKLKVREFRKPSSYLEHIFDCGNCNPRIKEYALCRHHNDFVQLSKKKGTSHFV